jgi:hypothetical protein
VVITRISKTGLKLVDSLDRPLHSVNRRKLGRLGRDELADLIAGLERVREAYEEEA